MVSLTPRFNEENSTDPEIPHFGDDLCVCRVVSGVFGWGAGGLDKKPANFHIKEVFCNLLLIRRLRTSRYFWFLRSQKAMTATAWWW